jgi:hypothetical protein
MTKFTMTNTQRGLTGAALTGAFLVALAGPSPAETAAPAPSPRAAFDQLKALTGQWQGHVTTTDGPAATVTYDLTGNGSAVVERLFPGTPHEMMSVYFMEGDDLVLTHYCAMGNQPHMKLARTSANPTTLVFDFAGGTNLDPAKDPHIHSGSIRILDRDRVEADWLVFAQGKASGTNKFFLAKK